MTKLSTTTGAPTVFAPQLPLLRLDLRFCIDEPVEVPPFRGNLWRGVLGPALKQIDPELYRIFFEIKDLPRPYVVDAPGAPGFRRLEPGTEERIGLTLVGRAATAAEAVLAAFDFAAHAGIGRRLGADLERGRAHLSAATAVWRGSEGDATVFDEANGYRPIAPRVPEVPNSPSRLRVELVTPLRLERRDPEDEKSMRLSGGRSSKKSRKKPIRPEEFSGSVLVANLVLRVSTMCRLYDRPLDTDFRALKALYENLRAEEPMVDFADQQRWSGSQKDEIPEGGIVGGFVLDMRGREALFPYLWLGQWLHAGKGTVMGMGSIRLPAE